MKIFYNPSFIVTTKSREAIKGREQGKIDLSYGKSILEENELIKDIVPNHIAEKLMADSNAGVEDCSGFGMFPGFTDPHTHIMYSGNRTEEFYQRIRGESYLDILKKGNGILKTVRDTRGKTSQQILEDSMGRIREEIRHGVTSIEIKSGYGLDTDTELSMIEAMSMLKAKDAVDVVSTFLGMHSIPAGSDEKTYTDFVLQSMLPKIRDKVDFVDCFCDQGAFSAESTDKLFEACEKTGLKLRVHADEISNIGCLDLAQKHRIVSADHLLKTDEDGIANLRDNGVIATILPITAFSLNEKYADARKFIDGNVPVAIGTDCSPLSPIPNMLFAMHLAVRSCGMTCEEALNAATINSSAAVGMLNETGTIEIGKRANFSLFDVAEPCELPYRWSDEILNSVYRNGVKIYGAGQM